MSTTWIVGPEWDLELFKKLGHALFSAGLVETKRSQGVGGSQEITQWHYASLEGELIIESETYIGLTVKGPETLIQKLKEQFGVC